MEMVIMASAGKGFLREDHSLLWRSGGFFTLGGEIQQLPCSPQMLFGRVQSFRFATQLNLPLQIPSRETLALVVENPLWKVIGKMSI